MLTAPFTRACPVPCLLTTLPWVVTHSAHWEGLGSEMCFLHWPQSAALQGPFFFSGSHVWGRGDCGVSLSILKLVNNLMYGAWAHIVGMLGTLIRKIPGCPGNMLSLDPRCELKPLELAFLRSI
ncbi:unnamed protein product [Eretmochelys imbricata]